MTIVSDRFYHPPFSPLISLLKVEALIASINEYGVLGCDPRSSIVMVEAAGTDCAEGASSGCRGCSVTVLPSASFPMHH